MLELIGDAFHRRHGAGLHSLERLGRARRDTRHRVAVRAGLRVAEHFLHALFHLRRHGVLQSLRLFVGLPPREPEHLDEKPLREPMAANDRVGVALPRLGQMHFFTVVQRDQAVPLEPMDHLRDGQSGEAEEVRQARRDDVAVLVAQGVDRLEILLDGGRLDNC